MTDLHPVAKKNQPAVLIVEDDPPIRELLTLYLEDWGAVVTAVATADAGKLELMNKNWALLLTDVRTPGTLNGIDLAWLASKLNPEIRLIVMSGYYDFADRVLPDNALFLPKPWPVAKLQEMISDQLSKPARAEPGSAADVVLL